MSEVGVTVNTLFCLLLVIPVSEATPELTVAPEAFVHANVTASWLFSTRHVSSVEVPDFTSRCPAVIAGEGGFISLDVGRLCYSL